MFCGDTRRSRALPSHLCRVLTVVVVLAGNQVGLSQTEPQSGDPPPTAPRWQYAPELLRPFWEGEEVVGESVLFLRDDSSATARASVLFPVREIVAVRNSVGDVTYQPGKDYVWKPDSRELVLPAGSSIPSSTPRDLRRPAKSQKYELTHRDGDGEIFFGAELEYAARQTCITYRHAPQAWSAPLPAFDPRQLPRTVARLVNRQPLTIVVLGDSISAGCNASALYHAPPFQPAFPELVRRHLAERFRNSVELKNLAVGGTDTAWGRAQVEAVLAAQPDLLIVAFGMNDSAGRAPEEYQQNIRQILAAVREQRPACEFILVASMLGNRDWVRLKHESFPRYRAALQELTGPGVALADLTSVWQRFLELKRDWDQTGNGVNHPNDFGHRVYAQVITALLDPRGVPDATPEPPVTLRAGTLQWVEQRLLGNYTYSYACAAADLNGDGALDLTSSDAEPNSNLYLLTNDGRGGFRPSYIQRYTGAADQPIRLERHAIGDINRDGRPDVVIVDNLRSDIRWFANPPPEERERPWPLRRIVGPGELPGAYDVALADLDADGDLDVAASSWNGQRFVWYENEGRPGNGESWERHLLAEQIGETRTIAVADFNRDGRPDLLGTTRTTSQIVWFENPTTPAASTWAQHLVDDSQRSPTHGHPVDFDGDGDLDILLAFGLATAASTPSHQVAWYENVGQPGRGERWTRHVIADPFPQGFEAVAGDLDGDHDLDVVATGWGPVGQLAWFENTGDPRQAWRQHTIKKDWPNAVTVLLADLDADGRLDIVACAERGANELRWWRNLGPHR
ncbi:MAG: FG-GAP-like repeat-containing protein [Pirellulales bacterium]